jgi:hypothetical protein
MAKVEYGGPILVTNCHISPRRRNVLDLNRDGVAVGSIWVSGAQITVQNACRKPFVFS